MLPSPYDEVVDPEGAEAIVIAYRKVLAERPNVPPALVAARILEAIRNGVFDVDGLYQAGVGDD